MQSPLGHYIQTDTVMSAGTSDCAAKQDRQTGAASTVSAGDSSENNMLSFQIHSFIQQNLSSLGL